MAKSLDGLIHHLVDQIALCGEHGASPSDFIAHVKYYYNHPIDASQIQGGDHAISPPSIASNVDRPFLEQVWTWLLRSPDVRLGSHPGHKQLTLPETEACNAALDQSEQLVPVSRGTDLPKDFAPSHASSAPNIIRDVNIAQTQLSAESVSAGTGNATASQETNFNPGIRLYASKIRMWHALTGHGPDLSKVKSLDFICLSIIAACGPKGILQNDLVRISGQDKRSLPARTDRLRDDGYVEKIRVSVQLFNPKRLLNTSKCTLKRFVNETSDKRQQPSEPGSAPARNAEQAYKSGRKQDIQTPKESSSITALESVPQSTALSEVRVTPSWTADRPVNNQIFELIDLAGIKGMSMSEIRDALMGGHIKKPLDEYVSRLVQSWQVSQPLHIRHLSVVRDTVLKGKTQIYMYYTYENFKQLVEGGTGFWEAVTTVPNEVMKGKNVAASLDAKPDMDEYGFPKLDETQFQGHHNDGTLEECVSALNVGPLHISAHDPVLRKQADGTYGVWYKSQQQHSVTSGNGPSSKKAAFTPTQAASIMTRTIETQKGSSLTTSGVVSTKSRIVEPEKVAVPRSSRPRVAPAKGRAWVSQIQTRKHVRNPDSKPRGRPRKYPKTGIPANFNTLTQEEVEYLSHSQEMFEKYELVKIEKEILRRTEDGENAVIAAHEVLAEWDDLRKQEGELPLPKTSRAQVLHKFAEEPLPEPDPDEARPKGRHRTDTPYRPSMAAHTYLIPALHEQKLPETEGPQILQTRTRRRGQSVSALESRTSPPSVAAHSWPYVPPPSSAMEVSTTGVMHNGTKRKQGRPAKPKQLPGLHFQYLPSIAAHSGLYLPLDTLSIARPGQNRKRVVNFPLEGEKESTIPIQYKYLPSTAAHSGSFLPPDTIHGVRAGQKRQRIAYNISQRDEHHTKPSISSTVAKEPCIIPAREVLLGTSNLQLGAGGGGMYPGWESFMSKYYQQQLETIKRSSAGVFYGKTTPRRKRPCEPPDFRPTHFKLAVFKSTRLGEVRWAADKSITSEQQSISGSEAAATLISQVMERSPVPNAQSPSVGQPDLPNLTALPSPAPPDSSFQPNPSYNSPYANVIGTKRKRTTSPEPTRGAVQFDPFSASPYSRQSSPITLSVKPINEAGTLPKPTALSPATDHVHRDAVVDIEAPTRTLERQPDMQNQSKPAPNTPVLDDSAPGQSKTATDLVMQSPHSPTKKASKLLAEQSIGKISRQGGSTAMLRKNIIMEIIEKCEGVFPSHKEMSSPFAAEWKRRGQQGTPETKTISNAVNALIREQRLRQITFTAQTRQGVVITKSILTVPSIDTTDPRVKEIQTIMAAYHPRHFIPLAVLPPQDNQNAEVCDTACNSEEAAEKVTAGIVHESSAPNSPESRRHGLSKKITDGKEKAAMARLKALKERDRQALEQAEGDDPSTELLIQRATKNAGQAKFGPSQAILPKPISQSSGGKRGQKRIERLASIKRAVPSQGTALPAVPLNGARQRIREIAENAARIEREQALADSTRYSLPDMNFVTGSLGSPYAPVYPSSLPWQAPISKIVTTDNARPGNQPLESTVPSENDLEAGKISPKAKRQSHAISNHLQYESLSITGSPSSESPLSCVSGKPLESRTEELGRYSQRVQVISFMDPVHYFHRATGTFSVTFSGLRSPRKTLAHRGTALGPYAANLKNVQRYTSYHDSNLSSSLRESQNAKKTLFDEEVDNLLRQELGAIDLKDISIAGWPFINHVFSHAHQTVQVIETDIEAAKQVMVRPKDGRLTSRRFPRDSDFGPKIGNKIFGTSNRSLNSKIAESRTPLKRRRLTSVVEHETQDDILQEANLNHEHRPSKLRRVRGPRQAKSLGENGEERLLTAVMVIRALTGGLDKRIDWVLVAKVFEPTYTQIFVHSRWNLTLQKYKLVLPKMESDFQSIFASAYEQGIVPALDYDKLEDYDWKWLVEWTMTNVDTPTQSLPELPVERSDFDALYTLNKTFNNETNEFYEIDGSSVLARRTKIVHRDPYVLPLVQKRQHPRPEDGGDLKIVKSWIRANIITPESTYNPSAARAKLSTFPERTIEDALKQLLLDRVLTQENKGRLIPGRNYDISEFLVSRLKKNLHSTHFHQAAAYKQQLDLDFQDKGFANYSFSAEDGDMIVVVNLQAHQRISVVPIGVPMNKWGQTDGGYETRQMDKRRLNFSLELRPSLNYVYGNPLTPLPAPPSHHLQDQKAKIPLWYDIHGALVPIMWEMALAASVAVLAVRPGIGATELEEAVRPAMEVWELQEILEWLVNARAAKRIGQGFCVEDEWWWLALGTGESNDECSGEECAGTNARGKWKEKERVENCAQDEMTVDLD